MANNRLILHRALRVGVMAWKSLSRSAMITSQPTTHQDLSREVFSTLRSYVASVVRKMLQHPSDVDDVVQEVFLALHQQSSQIRDLRCLKAWLSTIARRQCRRHLRQRPTSADEDVACLPARGPRPDGQAELAAMLQRLRTLPPQLSRPWALKHLDGETLPDIARRCGCSQSTVQRRIRWVDCVLLQRTALPIPESQLS